LLLLLLLLLRSTFFLLHFLSQEDASKRIQAVYRGKKERVTYQDQAHQKQLQLAFDERMRCFRKKVGVERTVGDFVVLDQIQTLDKSRFDTGLKSKDESSLSRYASTVHVIVLQTHASRKESKATAHILHLSTESESCEEKEDFRFSESKASRDRVNFAKQWVSAIRMSKHGYPYIAHQVIGGAYDGLSPTRAKEAAAVPIQTMYRSKVARDHASTLRRRDKLKVDMLLEIHVEEMSAIQIQRVFRGSKGRVQVTGVRKLLYRKLYEELRQEMAEETVRSFSDDMDGFAEVPPHKCLVIREKKRKERSSNRCLPCKGMVCLMMVWAPFFFMASAALLSLILYAIETDGTLSPDTSFASRNATISMLKDDIEYALLLSNVHVDENTASVCNGTTAFDIQQNLFDSQWKQGHKNGRNVWKEMSYQSCFLYTLGKLMGLKIPFDTAFVNAEPSQNGDSFLAEGIAAYSYTSSVVGGFAINVFFVVFSTCTLSMMSAIAAHLVSYHAKKTFRRLSLRAQISLNVKLVFCIWVVLIVTSCLFAFGFWKSVDISSEVAIFRYNYFDALSRSYMLLTGNNKPLGLISRNETMFSSFDPSASKRIGGALLRASASYGGFGFTSHKIISACALVIGLFLFKIVANGLFLRNAALGGVSKQARTKRWSPVRDLSKFVVASVVVILGICALLGYISHVVESDSNPVVTEYNDTMCILAVVDQTLIGSTPRFNSTASMLTKYHEGLRTKKSMTFWQGFMSAIRIVCGPIGPHANGSMAPFPYNMFNVQHDGSQIVVAVLLIVEIFLSGCLSCLLAQNSFLVFCIHKLDRHDRRSEAPPPEDDGTFGTAAAEEDHHHHPLGHPNLTHVVKLPGDATQQLFSSVEPFKWGSRTVAFLLTLVIFVPAVCLVAATVCAAVIFIKEDVSFRGAFFISLPIAFGLPGVSSDVDVSQLTPPSDVVTGAMVACAVCSFLCLRCLSYAIAFNLSASEWLCHVVIDSTKGEYTSFVVGKKETDRTSGLKKLDETRIDMNMPEYTGTTYPLKGLDKLMYILQSDTNPMVVNGFALLKDIPTLQELQKTIAKMVKYEPRLRSVVDLEGGLWNECTGIRFDDHVKLHGCYGYHGNRPVDYTINDFLQKHGSAPMNNSIPLWELHVLNMKDHQHRFPKSGMQSDVQCAIFLRIHHVIGDGVSILNLFDRFLSTVSADGVQKEGSLLSIGGRPKRKRSVFFWWSVVCKGLLMFVFIITCWPLWGLAIMLKMACMRSDPKNALRSRYMNRA
jgi:hypothetical protein